MLTKIHNYIASLFSKLHAWYDNIGTFPLLPMPNGKFVKIEYRDDMFISTVPVSSDIQEWLAGVPSIIQNQLGKNGPHILEGYLQQTQTTEFTREDVLWITDVQEVMQPDDYLFRYLDLNDIVFSAGDLRKNDGPVRLAPAYFPYRRSEIKTIRKNHDVLIHKVNGKYGAGTKLVYRDNVLVRLAKKITGQK